jgi:3-hydroxyacyl-[acyl-carrier-protein] dehydratase
MSDAAAAPDMGVEADVVRIMQMIPHRYPLLMIDRVIEMYADKGAVGIKNVSMGEPYFQGHFPGAPVMPGVMIVEAMAQTAAVLVVHTLGPASEGKLVYFMSIDNCRFRRPVYPGDQLHVLVEKERNRGPVWKFHGTAKVGDKVVAEAVFAAMVRENT